MIPINLYSLPRQPAYEAFLWQKAGNYIANRTARKNRAVKEAGKPTPPSRVRSLRSNRREGNLIGRLILVFFAL